MRSDMLQKYMFSGSFYLNGHDNDNLEIIFYISSNDNQSVPLVLVKGSESEFDLLLSRSSLSIRPSLGDRGEENKEGRGQRGEGRSTKDRRSFFSLRWSGKRVTYR